jgi:hypothetical protein
MSDTGNDIAAASETGPLTKLEQTMAAMQKDVQHRISTESHQRLEQLHTSRKGLSLARYQDFRLPFLPTWLRHALTLLSRETYWILHPRYPFRSESMTRSVPWSDGKTTVPSFRFNVVISDTDKKADEGGMVLGAAAGMYRDWSLGGHVNSLGSYSSASAQVGETIYERLPSASTFRVEADVEANGSLELHTKASGEYAAGQVTAWLWVASLNDGKFDQQTKVWTIALRFTGGVDSVSHDIREALTIRSRDFRVGDMVKIAVGADVVAECDGESYAAVGFVPRGHDVKLARNARLAFVDQPIRVKEIRIYTRR